MRHRFSCACKWDCSREARESAGRRFVDRLQPRNKQFALEDEFLGQVIVQRQK